MVCTMLVAVSFLSTENTPGSGGFYLFLVLGTLLGGLSLFH